MNAKILLATVAIAAAASGVARADDFPASSQYAIKFEGNRTRAEVVDEAVKRVAERRLPSALVDSRAAALPKSGLDPRQVRAEAIEALRMGKIPSGELSL